MSYEIKNSFAQRALDAIDLAIDFATLGEYGLEPVPAEGPCRERPGRTAGWEALTAARSRDRCDRPAGTGCDAATRTPRVRLRDLV